MTLDQLRGLAQWSRIPLAGQLVRLHNGEPVGAEQAKWRLHAIVRTDRVTTRGTWRPAGRESMEARLASLPRLGIHPRQVWSRRIVLRWRWP